MNKLRFIKVFYNRFLSPDKKYVRKIRTLTGFSPSNIAIYRQAFLHSSLNNNVTANNERLEYLGDSILDTVISELIFNKFPKGTEGFLTKTRSKIVSRKTLGRIAMKMGIGSFIEHKNIKLNLNTSVLGNTLEALIGAVYIDAGYDKTRKFIYRKIVAPFLDFKEIVSTELNYKSKLVEWTQKQSVSLAFEIIDEKDFKNKKLFTAQVVVDGKVVGKGEGKNKKTAENEAARTALLDLEQV